MRPSARTDSATSPSQFCTKACGRRMVHCSRVPNSACSTCQCSRAMADLEWSDAPRAESLTTCSTLSRSAARTTPIWTRAKSGSLPVSRNSPVVPATAGASLLSRGSWPHNGARHERSGRMSGVRVLVGTRKGAFILTADGKRERWNVSGPHFAGWEIYHVKGSLADPNRLYASQSSGWFGQVIQRSCDGGKTWETPGGGMGKTPDGMPTGESNKFVYDATPETGKPLTTHQWYDGTQHPWEFKRVWHLEPSLTDADTAYAGVEDAGLFRTTDRGKTWQELARLRGHGTGPKWQPGAGGMCLHTVLLDPTNPRRMYVAISAAGSFRSDDGGTTWKPINRRLRSQYIPDPNAEIGHCVHRIALNRSRPNVLFMQKHWDVMRSRSEEHTSE